MNAEQRRADAQWLASEPQRRQELQERLWAEWEQEAERQGLCRLCGLFGHQAHDSRECVPHVQADLRRRQEQD